MWQTLTEVMQHAVSLQLCVSDLVLKQDQFLLILALQREEPPLAVLQLIDEPLLDLDLARQVCKIGLQVH